MAVEKVTYIIEGKDRLSPVVNTANKSVSTLSATLATLGPALAVGAIVGGIAKVVQVSARFEKSMSTVKALTGATGKEFESLQNTAKELGRTTEFSASQSADAMGFLAQAGFDAGQIIKVLPDTLNLASAGSLDLARTADIASNILSGFGLEAEQMGKVSDVLAKTFTSTNVDLSQLGETFKQVGPVASGLGFQFNETAAAIGILGNAGIQGSLAGTSLKNSMVLLAKPTKAMSTIFDRLGVQTRGSSGELNSLSNILGQLQESGASAEDIMGSFGKIAGPGMLALLKSGSEGLTQLTNDLNVAGGTADRIAKTKLDNFSGQMTILMSTLEGVAIAIGDKILPALTSFVRGFVKAIGFISRNIDIIGAVAIGLTAFAIAINAVTIATKIWTIAQGLLNIVMALNPISLIVIGITLLIATIAIAWRESEIFRASIMGLWEGIKLIGENLFTMLIEPFLALRDVWDGLVDAFSGKGFGKLFEAFKRLGSSILTFMVQPLLQIAKGIDALTGTNLAETLKSATGIGDISAGVGEAIGKGFSEEIGKEQAQEEKKRAKDTRITTTAIGGAGGASALALGGRPTGSIGADIKGAQGTKMTNLTININKFVENLNISATTLTESTTKIKEEVAKALLTAVNDVNIISG